MRTVIAACGCGHDGRLGTGTCDSQDRVTLLPFFAQRTVDEDGNPIGDIRAVCVGGYHNFAITTTGVYGWGLNENGQLGLGTGSVACVATPQRIPFFDAHTAVEIACGSYHTLAWTVDGLFACGRNEDGQLGLVRDEDHYEFTRVLSPAQINGGEDRAGQWAGGEETEAHCVVRRGHLTHVSCGTHHSLLAFRDATIETEHTEEHEGDVHTRDFALVIAAAGKGDFGELGYDADGWSALQAKAKSARSALLQRLSHQTAHPTYERGEKGEKGEGEIPSPPLMQWAPLRVRRAAFSSCRFRPVALPAALMANPAVRVEGLRASHLHSAVVLRGGAGENKHQDKEKDKDQDKDQEKDKDALRVLHWGCYYCGGVEDDASSVPRAAGGGAVCVHGGAEWLLRVTASGADVMGSGAIGLGAEDSAAEDWTPLRTDGAVLDVSGREHCLLLAGDAVLGFGDNLHGQLAAAGDAVLAPAPVLRCGERIGGAVVEAIRNAVGGARHSVFLIDIAQDEHKSS